MKKISKKILIHTAIFSILVLPLVVFAQGGESGGNVSGGTNGTKVEKTGIVYTCKNDKGEPAPCDKFEDLINAINFLLNYIIKIFLALSIIPIVYAGWLYLNSGDNPGDRAKANGMLVNIAKGIFFMLAAWLIVTTLMNILVKPEFLQSVNFLRN